MGEKVNFLLFKLGEQSFAFEINFVKEVIEYRKITQIPLAPEPIEGIINLRGNAIPVVDLRKKLKISIKEITIETSIIIMEIKFSEETAIIGAIVDEVNDVVELNIDEIEPAPSMGMKIHPKYVNGILNLNNNFVIVVNIEKVFSIEELDEIKSYDPEKKI